MAMIDPDSNYSFVDKKPEDYFLSKKAFIPVKNNEGKIIILPVEIDSIIEAYSNNKLIATYTSISFNYFKNTDFIILKHIKKLLNMDLKFTKCKVSFEETFFSGKIYLEFYPFYRIYVELLHKTPEKAFLFYEENPNITNHYDLFKPYLEYTEGFIYE